MASPQAGHPPMIHCACIGGLVLLADAAAWVLSAQTGDSRWSVVIGAGTTIIISLSTAFVLAAPHIGRAITSLAATILPALALARKQNEELNKGTLSERIETLMEQNAKLQHAVEDDRTRTEDANKKLNDIRSEFNSATAAHREQREVMTAQLHMLTETLAATQAELKAARDEIREFHAREHAGQVRQDVKIEHHAAQIKDNRAAIRETKAVVKETAAAVERIAGSSSTEIPVVRLDEGGAAAG